LPGPPLPRFLPKAVTKFRCTAEISWNRARRCSNCTAISHSRAANRSSMACNRPSTSSTKLEITHACHEWFELGFYVFTSVDTRVGWQWAETISARESQFRSRGTGLSASASIARSTAHKSCECRVRVLRFGWSGHRFRLDRATAPADPGRNRSELQPQWEFNFGMGFGMTGARPLVGQDGHWPASDYEVTRRRGNDCGEACVESSCDS